MSFILLIFFAAVIVWAFAVEPRFFKISRHRVTLHKNLAGTLRILHLSDTHFSPLDFGIGRFFDRLSARTYDLIVVTGDIIDCNKGISRCIYNFRKLRSLHGIFAVFGNHDYYDYKLPDVIIHNFPSQAEPRKANDWGQLQERFSEIGVTVLRNETREILVNGTPVLIHGVDDLKTGQANIRKTMEVFDPRKLNFLLTHTVDTFLDIGEGEVDLSFSGHSHGGQVRLPFLGPIVTHTVLGRRYACGLRRLKGAVCSISRGLAASRFFFMRLMCRPEAVVLSVRGIQQEKR